MLDGAVVAFLICLQHFQWSERVICMQQFSLWPEAKYCLLNACDCFIRPRRVFSSPLQGTISVNGLSLLLLWSCRQQAAGLHTMFKHCHHGRVRLLFCVVGKWDMKLVWHYCGGNVLSDTRHPIRPRIWFSWRFKLNFMIFGAFFKKTILVQQDKEICLSTCLRR